MTQKLKEIMVELFEMKADAVTDALTMKDTDVWDSLKHMELIAAIENEFEVELSFDEIVAMRTFKEIKQVLGTKGIEG
jgi:acyl carrier protein